MLINFVLYTLPVIALISLALYASAYLLFFRRRGRLSFPRHAVLYAALGYCLSLIYLTILWYWPFLTFHAGYYLLNLKPFVWLSQTYEMGAAKMLEQLVLNIGMFVPWGLLLPMTFPRLRALWKTALTVLSTTLGIETLQYFLGRSADIDDVIMNLAGGLIGYAIFALCNRAFKGRPWWNKALGEPVA